MSIDNSTNNNDGEVSTTDDCLNNCKKQYKECLESASGNPTAQERCEKFN